MNALTLFPSNARTVDNTPVEVRVPGSKSYTIRALLLAAMTPAPVTLLNPLISDDTLAMLACLDALGVAVRRDADRIEVSGHIADVWENAYALNAHLSAATLRFLLALSAVLPGVQTLQGHEGLNRRPVRDLVDSLRALGAEIDYLGREGFPPVRVSSTRLTASTARVSGEISSQYLSALMMIAPAVVDQNGKRGLTLEVTGEIVSRPYLEMTAATMRAFGVAVTQPDKRTFVVAPEQGYHIPNGVYTVEGDASAACYPVAAAALNGSRLILRNLPADSVQADMRFLEILECMGNRVERHADYILFEGHGVHPMDVNMCDCPDQAQTLAVLLAFANGASRLDGLRSLRVKETDRLAAVARELTKMGIRVVEESEALVIHGGSPRPADIETYGDHRMAMAFAVAGARLDGPRILEPSVVRKTYPTFWDECPMWGIGVESLRSIQSLASASGDSGREEENGELLNKIVLIGFMGAGKSHLAALLSEKLKLDCVETDALIVARSGRASVRDIFERDGETRFRELELEVARDLRARRRVVISTGGGIVMNKLAIDYLREESLVVFLDATLDTLLSRLENATDRPLLRTREETAALYHLREPLYRHYASVCAVTDGKTPEALAEEVSRLWENPTSSACPTRSKVEMGAAGRE